MTACNSEDATEKTPVAAQPVQAETVKPPVAAQSPKPQPQKPAVAQSPKPKPAVAQSPKPKPAVAQSPKPKPAVAQSPKPKPAVAQSPKPKPAVAQSPKPKPQAKEQKSMEYMLAAIDGQPSAEKHYGTALDDLDSKCTEDRGGIGDMTVTAVKEIKKTGRIPTNLQVLEAIQGAIESTSASPSNQIQCAVMYAALVTLSQAQTP